MKVRTDTQCVYCTHNQVCIKLNRPINVVEAIVDFNEEDDNGIVVVVSCTDFEEKMAHTKTDHNFGFDC